MVKKGLERYARKHWMLRGNGNKTACPATYFIPYGHIKRIEAPQVLRIQAFNNILLHIRKTLSKHCL